MEDARAALLAACARQSADLLVRVVTSSLEAMLGLTVASGQGEAIEEAVRREVAEEAGVPVGPVQILGSQPWPIGACQRNSCLRCCVSRARDMACRRAT